MAIQGTFTADFNSFNAAVEGAEVRLKSFEGSSNRVEGALSKMTNSFSGVRVIQDATLMAREIESVGGVTAITESELRPAAVTANEVAAKMTALGQDVPPGIQKISDAAKALDPNFTLAGKAAGVLTSAFGQFTLANL